MRGPNEGRHMEGRKLQIAGGSTYMISLPPGWVKGHDLKPGDTLFVDPGTNGSVVVSVSAPAAATRHKIFLETVDGSPDHLLRKLIGAYIAGFGVIETRFPPARSAECRRVAREFCRLVTGAEVIDESGTSLVIQDVTDPSELSPVRCVRRMHMVVRAMVEDAFRSLREGDTVLANEVMARSADVDRLSWMVAKRHRPGGAERKGSGLAGGAPDYRLVAKLLERTGDHAVRIAHFATVLGERAHGDARLVEELQAAGESALTILDRSVRAFLAGDLELANEAIDARERHLALMEEISHRVASKKGSEVMAWGSVLVSLERTAENAADIAEQAIHAALLTESAAPTPVRA